jgi:O-antigen ligase
MAPWWVYHPYSLPKLLPLSAFGLGALMIITKNISWIWLQNFKVIIILTAVFIFWSLITLIFADGNFFQKFYGIDGRNTGFLAYFSLSILLLGAAISIDQNSIKVITSLAIILGLISIAYSIFQAFGFFKLTYLQSDTNIAPGFLGNINFQSAFIGMVCTVALSQFLSSKSSSILKVFYFLFIVFGLYAISLINSQQGFFVMASGITIVLLIYLKTLKHKLLTWSVMALSFSGFILTALATQQIGPLTKYVYEQSISNRGFYWTAGLKMFLDNPIFGIGFDSYRDWYFRKRTSESIKILGPNDFAENAHNIFIDIAASGGTILIVTYILLNAYILKCAIHIIRHTKKFDSNIAAVCGAWIAFNVQSVISINQLGLSIWGWILGGSIIGYRLKLQEVSNMTKQPKVKPKFSFIWSTGLILGIILVIFPLKNSYGYRLAIENQDLLGLKKTALSKPYNAQLMTATVPVFVSNNLPDTALEIALAATKAFPDYFAAWYEFSKIPRISIEELNQANLEMVRLNPSSINDK